MKENRNAYQGFRRNYARKAVFCCTQVTKSGRSYNFPICHERKFDLKRKIPSKVIDLIKKQFIQENMYTRIRVMFI